MSNYQIHPAYKMNGTSFSEQVIFYYISKVTKAENRIKIGKYEIDIFLPELNLGIEYDGKYFHSTEKKKNIDKRKDAYCKAKGVRLIRIKEAENDGVGDGVIYMCYKNYTTKHYSFVMDELCELLSLPHVGVNIKRDSVLILQQYAIFKENQSLAFSHPELVKEWDIDKNGELTPDMVSAHSHDYVWWKCKHGHSWLAQVGTRTRRLKTGCPYCSGRLCLPGVNDLQTKNPPVAAEWHPTRNGVMKPSEVAFTSRQKAWFKCVDCGHEWQAIIANRSAGRGCPVCSKKRFGKAMTKAFVNRYGSCIDNPILAKEWAYDLNIGIDPITLVRTSNKSVYWRCSDCGYIWKTRIVLRAMYGKGCPECGKKKRIVEHNRTCLERNGCFLEIRPDLLEEWDWDRNKDIDPYQITKMSHKKVWWKCHRCGTSFFQSVAVRVRNKTSPCSRHNGKKE